MQKLILYPVDKPSYTLLPLNQLIVYGVGALLQQSLMMLKPLPTFFI